MSNRWKERHERAAHARTTLIDTLRLVDMGMLDEAALGAGMALAFLSPVTNGDRVVKLAEKYLPRSQKDERVFW